MKIDDVIDRLVEKFSAEAALADILTYHKVNGMLPDIGVSASVGCSKVKYTGYTNSKDQADADVNIYVYTQEPDPEHGEQVIRGLAEAIRYVLTEDWTLGGILAASSIEEIEYIYADADETTVLHAAVVKYKPTFYQDRMRPQEQIPVETINYDIGKDE